MNWGDDDGEDMNMQAPLCSACVASLAPLLHLPSHESRSSRLKRYMSLEKLYFHVFLLYFVDDGTCEHLGLGHKARKRAEF